MAEAWAERTHDRPGPKVYSPAMKQPMFNWNAQDKYSELKTFWLEVNNILSTYNTPQTEKLALVKNWLGRKGLQYLETLTTAEKETCNTLEGLFKTLSNIYMLREPPRTFQNLLHPIEGAVFQFSLRPDEVHSSRWKLVYKCNQSSVTESNYFITSRDNRMRNLHKIHHYCFAREVLVITDHKPLVAIFKKDMATLSQCIQCILLKIYQYRVQIIYKPVPKIFIADWLSWHNHKEGNRHPRMCLHLTDSASISTGQTPPTSKKHCNYRLAEYKGWASQQLKTILVL